MIRQREQFDTSQGKYGFFDKPSLNWSSNFSALAGKPVLWLLCGISAIVVILWAALGFLFLSESSLASNMASPHQQKVSSTYKPSSSEANLCSNDGASKYKSAFSFHVSQKKENPISSDQEWQDVINLILTAPSEASILSERLAFLLQEFPLEGQVEAAHHMVNLLSDIDYYTAERVFLDKHLPHQVHRVVFEDLLSRPNYIKLPVLVKVVRDFSHPLHREALENLRVLTGKDKGFIELQSWDLIVREFLDKKLESHQ